MLTGPGAARVVSVYRSGDEPTPDPVVILEQVRDMRTLKEQLSVRNRGRHSVTLNLDMEVAADFAPTFVIKRVTRALHASRHWFRPGCASTAQPEP